MRKILLVVMVLTLLVMVGCSQTNDAGEIPQKPAGGVATIGEPPSDITWISPGKVEVGNYYPGATAEWTMKVHNGSSERMETFKVTTEIGEDSITLPLKAKVWQEDINNISVVSDLESDLINVDSYDYGTDNLTISGMADDSVRIFTIEYIPESTPFSVNYRHPDNVDEGYAKPPDEAQDWVIIADTTPVLAPYETRDILVVLAMPQDAEVFAPKWEFWVSVKDTSQTGFVAVELACRWLVSMRP